MIEVLTMSIFVFSSIYGAPTAAIADTISASSSVAPLTKIEEKTTTNIPPRKEKELEKQARLYFKDEPILVEIARCESQFRQYDENGKVLKGKVNKGDIGLMQINKYYHAEKANSLGFDLKTVEGNMAYAKYLYNREGVKPWISSSDCWIPAIPDDQVAVI